MLSSVRESADRTSRASEFHHPALYEFSLLAGITAVYNFVGTLDERLHHVELPADAFVINNFYVVAFG